jgi:hypothetical protein
VSDSLSEVDPSRVALVGFTDSFGKASLAGWDRDQVNVIRHETPSEILHSVDSALLSQELEVCIPIIIREEDVHAANTSLGDMVRKAGNDDSRDAGHGTSLS